MLFVWHGEVVAVDSRGVLFADRVGELVGRHLETLVAKLDPERATKWANGQVRGPRHIPVVLNR